MDRTAKVSGAVHGSVDAIAELSGPIHRFVGGIAKIRWLIYQFMDEVAKISEAVHGLVGGVAKNFEGEKIFRTDYFTANFVIPDWELMLLVAGADTGHGGKNVTFCV